MTPQFSDLMGIKEAAAKLRERGVKVGDSTLRQAAKNGQLQAVKVGKHAWATTLKAALDYHAHRPRMGRPRKSSVKA